MSDANRGLAIPTTAVVLAGGLGTRLRPAVTDRPKVLALIAGKPFLSYVLAYLAAQGMTDVILCVGYLAEQIKAFAGDGRSWNLTISYSEEQNPLGTGGALRQAAEGLRGPFFALNGDTLFLADLRALWQAHTSSQAAATLALLTTANSQARGHVTLSETGKILAFDEKPAQASPANVKTSLINAGVYLIEPQALESIQPGQQASLERQVFPQLATQGLLAGQVQSAYFADIGTSESLAAFEQDVVNGIVRIV